AQHDHPRVAETLLAPWTTFTPALRREILESLFARSERLSVLLAAMEEKKVLGGPVGLGRLEHLRSHRDPAGGRRAAALLAGQTAPDRRKILEDYQSCLALKADAQRGKGVFKKSCATCHRLENEGVEVGADLLAALGNKTPEQLLIDILDPS